VGCWRRLHNEELQIKEDEMSGACGTHGRLRNAYNILVTKPDHLEDLGIDDGIILEWKLGK
jgi:hypothetical protein